MVRDGDWKSRLWRFLHERRKTPFAWGSNDCAVFAADAVQVMTGEDLAGPFRDTYQDEAGADAVLAANGWDNLSDLADQHLTRLSDDQRAQRGDVVLISGRSRTRDFLAICLGPDAVGPGVRGLQRCSLSGRLAAWKVG